MDRITKQEETEEEELYEQEELYEETEAVPVTNGGVLFAISIFFVVVVALIHAFIKGF